MQSSSAVIELRDVVDAYGSDRFAGLVKAQIERLDPQLLPLQQGMSQGSVALGQGFSVMLLDARERAAQLQVKVGVFYQGIVPGCGCADDPTPVEPHPEYCELIFDIDKQTGRAQVRLAEERSGS